MNPNQAFKDREYTGSEDMGVTEAQLSSIVIRLFKHNITWNDLCVAAIGYDKNLKDLTFLEAARCIIAAGIWDNLKGK